MSSISLLPDIKRNFVLGNCDIKVGEDYRCSQCDSYGFVIIYVLSVGPFTAYMYTSSLGSNMSYYILYKGATPYRQENINSLLP